MCGTRSSAQISKTSLRAFLLGAAMSLVWWRQPQPPPIA